MRWVCKLADFITAGITKQLTPTPNVLTGQLFLKHCTLPNVSSMMGQHRRRSSNIKTALGECLVGVVSIVLKSGWITQLDQHVLYCTCWRLTREPHMWVQNMTNSLTQLSLNFIRKVKRILPCQIKKRESYDNLNFKIFSKMPTNTKHLYNIFTMAAESLRRWSNIAQMLYKCFVFAEMGPRFWDNFCHTYIRKNCSICLLYM